MFYDTIRDTICDTTHRDNDTLCVFRFDTFGLNKAVDQNTDLFNKYDYRVQFPWQRLLKLYDFNIVNQIRMVLCLLGLLEVYSDTKVSNLK